MAGVDLRSFGEMAGRFFVFAFANGAHPERQMSLKGRGIEGAQPQGQMGVISDWVASAGERVD